MGYKIKFAHGHWEVVDAHGTFVCSADTYGEAVRDVSELEAAVETVAQK